MAKKEDNQNKGWENIKAQYLELSPYITIMLFVILCWLFWSRQIESNYYSGIDKSEEKAGQLGDSYGVITSFFSALAFAGIALTIYLQRKELTETRKEFSTQNATLKRQRFEGTFFNMMSIHFKIKERVDAIIDARIKAFMRSIPEEYREYKEEHKKVYNQIFNEQLLGYLPTLSQYLQSLVSLHQLIKNSKFKTDVENRYLDILSNYISIPEKQLLFYFAVLAKKSELRQAVFDLAPDLIFNLTSDYISHESHVNLYPLNMKRRKR